MRIDYTKMAKGTKLCVHIMSSEVSEGLRVVDIINLSELVTPWFESRIHQPRSPGRYASLADLGYKVNMDGWGRPLVTHGRGSPIKRQDYY